MHSVAAVARRHLVFTTWHKYASMKTEERRAWIARSQKVEAQKNQPSELLLLVFLLLRFCYLRMQNSFHIIYIDRTRFIGERNATLQNIANFAPDKPRRCQFFSFSTHLLVLVNQEAGTGGKYCFLLSEGDDRQMNANAKGNERTITL